MCNLPIQILGNAPYPKYVKDYLDFGGAEVLIVDSNTKENILKFDPFPDDQMKRENMREKSEKTLKKPIRSLRMESQRQGQFGVQVIIRPVKRKLRKPRPKQKRLTVSRYLK